MQALNKQTLPIPVTITKKPTQTIQRQQKQEQSFTVVGNNRQKNATPSLQQQQLKSVRIQQSKDFTSTCFFASKKRTFYFAEVCRPSSSSY